MKVSHARAPAGSSLSNMSASVTATTPDSVLTAYFAAAPR